MIKILLLILAILAVSTLGFKVRNKLEDNRLEQTEGSRLETQGCYWDPFRMILVCD